MNRVSSFLQTGEFRIHYSQFDAPFNRELLEQFLAAQNRADIKKTHFFNGRFENVYLTNAHAPLLADLKKEAGELAARILGRPIGKMGCWCNAMGPGAETTLHSHDDDDEVLSGVYYVRVPSQSGELVIHTETGPVKHPPREGQWVFFSPRTPHAVLKNRSSGLRLSIAFNFS